MAFFLKLSYSKVRASFTHLGRGGHLYLISSPHAMFRILSVTCLITRIALRLIIHVRLRMSVCNFGVASTLRT